MNKDAVGNQPSDVLSIVELLLKHPEAPTIVTILALAILGWKALDLYKRR